MFYRNKNKNQIRIKFAIYLNENSFIYQASNNLLEWGFALQFILDKIYFIYFLIIILFQSCKAYIFIIHFFILKNQRKMPAVFS